MKRSAERSHCASSEVIAEQVEPAPFASVGNVQMEVEYAETALRIAAAAVAAAGKPVKVETAILQGDSAAALSPNPATPKWSASVRWESDVSRRHYWVPQSQSSPKPPTARSRSSALNTRRPKPGSALIVVAVNHSPGNDDVVEQALVEAQLRHAPVLALGVWRQDLGEMPS